MVAKELTPDATEIFGSKVTHELEAIKASSDVILVNR